MKPSGYMFMLLLSLCSTPIAAVDIAFVATLDSAQVDCAGGAPGYPGASGSATLSLDTATGVVTYFIEYSALSSPLAAAHVHGPGPACGTAPALYDLPLTNPMVGATTLNASQMQDMLNELHFIVFHTQTFFIAEIRGQVLPVAPSAPFQRSDCNTDGLGDLADAISILSFLFLDGAQSLCPDACDTNDSGAINVADAIYLLSALFLSGTPPFPPWPTCGADPTGDPLNCFAAPCL
ncbi:MAG: CHRD domain-containing protein [Planctomycetota bacterium]